MAKTLVNIYKQFIKGHHLNYPSGWNVGDPNCPTRRGCVLTNPAYNYLLCAGWWVNNPYQYNCEGIFLDAEGYNRLVISANVSGSWGATLYIDESDTIDGSYTNITTLPSGTNMEVPISKSFLHIWGYGDFGFGSLWIEILRATPTNYISGTVKTPNGYPVYNAIVNSNYDTKLTDKNGKFTNLGIYTDPGENIATVWAEKTINKSILNMTAKDISVLKEINVDT